MEKDTKTDQQQPNVDFPFPQHTQRQEESQYFCLQMCFRLYLSSFCSGLESELR